MKEKEMELIADFIDRLLIKKENPWKIKKEVKGLTKQFPLITNN
jgi:glycine/serine hydroxymethyltransferase